MDTPFPAPVPVDAAEAQTLAAALRTLPCFAGSIVAGDGITRLAGLTNRVYRIATAEHGAICLRIPGAGTAALVDRAAERANAEAAADAGVAPPVLAFAPDGTMVTPALDAARPLTPGRIAANPAAIDRAAQAFRRLHDTARPFPRRFEPFGILSSYLARLPNDGDTAHLRVLLAQAEPARRALAKDVRLAPCHCDPTGGNVLDDGAQVWLIDWEYSGQNDPIWDLAYFAREAHLAPDAINRLLSSYSGRAPGDREFARLALTQTAIALLSAGWALIRHADGGDAMDFLAYARKEIGVASREIAEPAFAAHCATLLA